MLTEDFFTFLGFVSNPFENNTAEREPDIDKYAVRPPYLDRVLNTSNQKGIFVLSGSRGSGKSATRLTVAKNLWNSGSNPLVIPFISFNVFRPHIKNQVPLDFYADQFCFLVVENILGWLSTLDESEAFNRLRSLNSEQKSLTDRLISDFYLNRSDDARANSGRECFEVLDVSLARKGSIWLEKRWDQVASVVSKLATSAAKKYADFDIGDAKGYEDLLLQHKKAGFSDPLYIFSKAVEFARAFGFTGIVVHIDKVDETDWTNTSVSAAGDLIYPLLSNIQLHEIDGLTWTFFLWDKVRDYLCIENDRHVRWDKIPNGKITWNQSYLIQLIDKRIQHFSQDKVNELAEICEPGLDINSIREDLFQLSEKSPRNLITLLDVVLSEHIQLHQTAHCKLNLSSFELGMDSYSISSVANMGMTSAIEQLTKLQAQSFVTKEVASRYRISNPAARSKIDKWIEMGLVEHAGSKVGPTGGRPVDQFEVSDPRLQRIIARKLTI